jgi:hypothetical protein
VKDGPEEAADLVAITWESGSSREDPAVFGIDDHWSWSWRTRKKNCMFAKSEVRASRVSQQRLPVNYDSEWGWEVFGGILP